MNNHDSATLINEAIFKYLMSKKDGGKEQVVNLTEEYGELLSICFFFASVIQVDDFESVESGIDFFCENFTDVLKNNMEVLHGAYKKC